MFSKKSMPVSARVASGGMAAAMEMMTGVRAFVWQPLFAGLIVVLMIWSSYRHIARVFKWLTLVLLANSDGLAKSFGLANGDVSTSPFAKLFLGLFVK